MWSSILLRGFILVVLVTANYNDPASETVFVQKDGESETIQINMTLVQHSQLPSVSEDEMVLNATRVNGTTAFSYRLDIQQWRLSDPPGMAGATGYRLKDSVNLPASEYGIEWSAATGIPDSAYRFANECNAVLVSVAINVTDKQPIFYTLKPDQFRMLN